ncbi:MAG: HPr family phosphocarrier protein [Kiritimatiellae bacterium]|nr:HPr family phosphocarrier protein [Kiritimatiellia bacterium]
MVEMTATIRNAQGIHCRPSAVIVKAVADYAGRIVVASGRHEVELRSLSDLVLMGIGCGERVRIRVSGPDEGRACQLLVDLFQTNFDFPPRDESVPAGGRARRLAGGCGGTAGSACG